MSKRLQGCIIGILISFFVCSTSIFAQTGRISGKVIDDNSFSLTGANVYIQTLNIGTATDNEGSFSLFKVPAGDYEVRVSFLGYQTETQKITVQENKTTSLNFTLKPGVVVGQEVLVLGDQLKGQAKALNQQKNNMNITNVVSADQIGRFPDENIGDALKRIPSITVNYDQGEARFGNIRGTEPRLNSFTINGERVPSAEAESRTVQLDLVSSDMIQTIEVNKAVTPDMDADAIGGSVNLVTKGAPNRLRISGTVGGLYNKISEKGAPSGALTVGQRFADGMLGIVLNGSYHDNQLGSNNTEGAWTGDPGNYYPTDWEAREYQIRRLRENVGANVDLKIDPYNTIYLKGIFSHRNDWEHRYRLRYTKIKQGDDGQWTAEIRRQTKGGPDNDENDDARLEDQRMWTGNLSGEHFFAGGIELNWTASLSKASEDRPDETYIQWKKKNVPVTVNLSDLRKPMITDNLDITEFGLDEITKEHQYTDEKNLHMKADLTIPLTEKGPYKNSIKFGGKYKSKDKKRDNSFFTYTPINKPDNILSYPYSDYTNPDFLAGNYKVGIHTSAAGIGQIANELDNPALFEKEDTPSEYASDNFSATEKVTAAYFMLQQQLGDKLSMIAGFRYEKTNEDYDGHEFDEDSETIVPTSGSGDYSNFLPGIHFKYDFDENTTLRLAWTNTIARPNYYDLVPYRSIASDYEELSVGNPTLNPTTSMNFDLMAENYFKSVGLVSAGAFYKDIKDFIYVFSEKNYLDPVSGNTYDKFSQPRNGAKATLFGLEFAFQRRLDFLGGFFSNFNIYTNYTYTHSSAKNPVLDAQVSGDKDIELPGTSPHIFNANLTYQDEKLVLGLSFNYSAAYIDPDEMDLTPGLERYYDDVTRLDFNGSYAFTPSIRFFVEANNLTNQPLRYYAGIKDRTYQAEYYDIKINTGVKFDF